MHGTTSDEYYTFDHFAPLLSRNRWQQYICIWMLGCDRILLNRIFFRFLPLCFPVNSRCYWITAMRSLRLRIHRQLPRYAALRKRLSGVWNGAPIAMSGHRLNSEISKQQGDASNLRSISKNRITSSAPPMHIRVEFYNRETIRLTAAAVHRIKHSGRYRHLF